MSRPQVKGKPLLGVQGGACGLPDAGAAATAAGRGYPRQRVCGVRLRLRTWEGATSTRDKITMKAPSPAGGAPSSHAPTSRLEPESARAPLPFPPGVRMRRSRGTDACALEIKLNDRHHAERHRRCCFAPLAKLSLTTTNVRARADGPPMRRQRHS